MEKNIFLSDYTLVSKWPWFAVPIHSGNAVFLLWGHFSVLSWHQIWAHFLNVPALDNQSALMPEVGNNKRSVNCKNPAIWLVVDRMSIHKKCPLVVILSKYYDFEISYWIMIDISYQIKFGTLLPMSFLAEKFEKWAHIWCQLITKSDLIDGIDFRNIFSLNFFAFLICKQDIIIWLSKYLNSKWSKLQSIFAWKLQPTKNYIIWQIQNLGFGDVTNYWFKNWYQYTPMRFDWI